MIADKKWMQQYFDTSWSANTVALGKRWETGQQKLCCYGIDYLDDQLGGIHPNEIILLGAKSGAGKTTIAEHIVMHNINEGKTVAFFRLEGDATEFYDRMQYQLVKNMIKSDGKDYQFSFANYRMGKTKEITGPYDEKAATTLSTQCENLYIYNNQIQLNNAILKDMMNWTMKQGVDLILIDHIHYFDWGTKTKEYEEEKEAMKTLQKCSESNGVPVIMISHVRKKQGNAQVSLVPDEDDYHGSSDKHKIAITSIMIGKYPEQWDEENRRYATLVRILKSRNGASTNKVGLKLFDANMQTYLDGYSVYAAHTVGTKNPKLIQNKLGYTWDDCYCRWNEGKDTQKFYGKKGVN